MSDVIAVAASSVDKVVEGEHYLVKRINYRCSYEPAILVDHYNCDELYFRFLDGSVMDPDNVAAFKRLDWVVIPPAPPL